MATPICLVVYLKPNAAEIQMLAVERMSALALGRHQLLRCKRVLSGVKRTNIHPGANSKRSSPL
jgi:hypothetical protein